MKKLRYLFEGIVLCILYAFFKILPVTMASNIGGALGKFIGPKLAASRKPLKNLKLAFPEKNDHELKIIIEGMWDNLGRVFAEYPHIKKISAQHVQIKNVDILEHAIAQDCPVILYSGHLANWEIMAPSLCLQKNIAGLLVYREPNNPIAAYVLNKARQVDKKLSFATKSEQGVRDMLKTMRNKGILGLLIDQKFNRGLEVPLFGHPAMTSPAFIEMAKKYNAIVVPLQLERTQGPNFIVTCNPALNLEKEVEEILLETHILLEDWITQKPEQWLWLHKRWKDDVYATL